MKTTKTALIASLMSCHLLWGVACGDVVETDTGETKEFKADGTKSPGVVLFNLSNKRTNDVRPAYYDVPDDPNRYPNNMMFEAIATLPANNRLWTIYPDAFPEATNTLRSWREFDVHEWNGTDPLPRMRPESFVRRIEDFQKTGALTRDLSGYSFLLDWEHGATAVREMGLTYWSDTASPRFRTAWIAYRSQVLETLRTLQARFPTSFFAIYAGGSTARVVGQNDARTAPAVKDARGKRSPRSYLHDLPERVRKTIRENYAEAMGPLLEAPDFHTVVCYDAYGPLDWDDQDGFPPSKNETYIVENFRLLRDNSTKPVYGIVGAFTSGNKTLSHDGESNVAYQMYWKDRTSWLKRTCRWLASADADGALVWNGLDALIFRYLRLNVRNYGEINDEQRRYLDPEQIGGWNQWISLDQQSGTLFKELARLHGQPDTRNYQTAERYYDNISLSQRQSDETIDIFLKTMSRTWKEYLLDDLLSTLRTGIVPLHIESDPQVKSDRETGVVGSTLYVVDRTSGELKSIDYQWMRNGDSLGASSEMPVYEVVPADVGAVISCRVTYRAADGSEPVVRIARFEKSITTPTLATIQVVNDGAIAQGNAEPAMARIFGVERIEPFTLKAGNPLVFRANDARFPKAAGRTQSWTIENGKESITITVSAESIRRDGDSLTIDDDTLVKTLLSGYRNVITEISIGSTD
tara:strand:- start:176 stop:2257 length:2082 start_codon:yes stop_codon:yes gene_type:complete